MKSLLLRTAPTLSRLQHHRTIGLQNAPRILIVYCTERFGNTQSSPPRNRQALPIGEYYALILDPELLGSMPAMQTTPVPTPPSSDEIPKMRDEDIIAKARVVFGSRLAGPAERRDEIDRRSTLIAGVKVPPKPVEPDNCCMSGCVNCVWDRYGEELEAWALAGKKAREALQANRSSRNGSGPILGGPERGEPHTVVSMDDDGGGSEANWGFGLDNGLLGDADSQNGDLLSGIPVGIREFIKTEKKLKDRHLRRSTACG